MKQFKNLHSGERCFILGNGPSLKDFDWSILEGETWFGTNRIYLSGHTPTYYVAVNNLVINQFQEDIDNLQTVKFLPAGVGGYKVHDLDTSLNFPMFSSPEGPIWEGHTVTYVCLQLAFYMGFKEVILLGVDHYYGDVKQPNLEVVATGYDENHFHPDYFSQGTRWHLPDLERSELAYSLAKLNFDAAGRKVINCTSQTRLRIFDLMPLSCVISSVKPRVSAIVSAYKTRGDDMLGLMEDQLTIEDELHETVIVCQKDTVEWKLAMDFRDHVGDLWCTIVETEDIPTIYHAWNLGIKFAKGKYLTNANTDDRHHPLAYNVMANILDARPDIDLVYHDSYITWQDETWMEFAKRNNGKMLVNGRFENQPGVFFWGEYSRQRLAHGCFIGPHPMWRASLHQLHGGFLDNYKIAGDYEFWLRISESRNFLHIPQVLGLYRASLKGAELSHPEIAADEGTNAIYVHQNPGASITPVDSDTIRVGIGDDWSFINVTELQSMLNQIKEQS